jgi:hypothetical protein
MERGLGVSRQLVAADLADSMVAVRSMQVEAVHTAKLSWWV